jgi:GT2 family glycosyltransferase
MGGGQELERVLLSDEADGWLVGWIASADGMIDIIIPVYNHSDYLDLCLKFIKEGSRDYRVILVDAGSDAETASYLDTVVGAEVIRDGRRLSFAQACNMGLRRAASRYVALLNTDVIVSKGWLEGLQRYLDSDDNIAMVSAISNWQHPMMGFAGYGSTTIKEILPVADKLYEWMSQKAEFEIGYSKKIECYACLARNALLGFDEDYENGFEDYDLCSRLNEQGYKVCLAPNVMVYHFGAVSRGLEALRTNERLYEKKRVSIPTVVPMRDGHFLNSEVVESLSNQSRKMDVYPIVTARCDKDKGDGVRPSPGYFSQADARNTGKATVLKSTDSEFIYLQDCSVVLKDSGAIQGAIDRLKADDKLGVVYFNVHPDFPGELEHFSAASMIMKRAVAEQVDFVAESTYQCFCEAYARSVVAKGWEVQYYKKEPVGFEVARYGRNSP